MGFYGRISDILSANLSDFTERFEDPEKMLKQAIREMEASISEVTGQTAIANSPKRTEAGVDGPERRVDVRVMIGPPARQFPGQSDRGNRVDSEVIGRRFPAFLPDRLGGPLDTHFAGSFRDPIYEEFSH
jgi:hypothetical protein